MGIESVSRLAPPLAWAVPPAPERPAPTPPAPERATTPDFAEFLADRAQQREIERFTYADLLGARRIAIHDAQRIARAQANAAHLACPHHDAACSPVASRPRHAAPLPAVEETPVVRAGARMEFRRAVETVDNRGSLIDILL